MSVLQQRLGIMRLTTDGTPSPIDAAIAALEQDLLLAEQKVGEQREAWLQAGTDDRAANAIRRGDWRYSEGFRDAIRQTINHLNRGNR